MFDFAREIGKYQRTLTAFAIVGLVILAFAIVYYTMSIVILPMFEDNTPVVIKIDLTQADSSEGGLSLYAEGDSIDFKVWNNYYFGDTVYHIIDYPSWYDSVMKALTDNDLRKLHNEIDSIGVRSIPNPVDTVHIRPSNDYKELDSMITNYRDLI